MERLKGNIKRVKPLIRYRAVRLSTETIALNVIREAKMGAVAKLKENQRLYLEGLKTLNEERQSGGTGRLLTLESSLDVVKSRWFEALKELRKVEEQEKMQVVQVMIAQKDVKTLEKLEERYGEELKAKIDHNEQKEMDEIGLRQPRFQGSE